MSPYVHPSRWYLRLPRWSVRLLSVIAIDGLWAWFLLKFFLPSESGALEVAVGALAVVAIIAAIPLMLSTYAFRANAPDEQIDERERAERYRAYYWTLLYLLTGVLIAFIAVDAKRLAPLLSMGVVSNLLQVLFLTTLALPTAILAWRDRATSDEE
ncbi:MAG: hypothetical protein RLZZ621_2492 [Gemmatimonadota bacterium]|jgi:L-asparagine transporter-like permease